MVRIFLIASALIWLPYGVYCFFAPQALAELAGVASSSTTGSVELRAMYGGLQAALGVFAAAALWRPALQRPALLAIAFLCAGLFTARLLGAAIEAELSSYTAVGAVFETASFALAARLSTTMPEAAPA